MISYAISAAIKSKLFDYIVVSTDDTEIASIAKIYGAEIPFIRPKNISDDQTATVPVVAHAIEKCNEIYGKANEVCCIYPGVPFISIDDLSQAHNILTSSGANYVFPVAEFPSPIQRALKLKANGEAIPFYSKYVDTRTQDLEPSYFDVGQFYWGKASAWFNCLNLHLNSVPLVIPEWRAVDIDTPSDWKRAELLYKVIKENF